MEANISIGTFCPNCNIVTGTHVVVGGKANCIECGGELVEAPKEFKIRVITNYTCICGNYTGYMSVMGTDASCSCGRLIP